MKVTFILCLCYSLEHQCKKANKKNGKNFLHKGIKLDNQFIKAQTFNMNESLVCHTFYIYESLVVFFILLL